MRVSALLKTNILFPGLWLPLRKTPTGLLFLWTYIAYIWSFGDPHTPAHMNLQRALGWMSIVLTSAIISFRMMTVAALNDCFHWDRPSKSTLVLRI